MDQKYILLSLAFVLILFGGLIGCSKSAPNELVLFDFETDAELDRIHWKCFTLFSLSDNNVTHGGNSLKMELYPSNWPGLTPKLDENDWRGYSQFKFDVFNPAPDEIKISVRIDDRKDYPDYEDRYAKQFILKPGMNRIEIPLDSLVTSGTKRNLDLKNIYRLLIFMGHPREKHVLYLDYIRLVRS